MNKPGDIDCVRELGPNIGVLIAPDGDLVIARRDAPGRYTVSRTSFPEGPPRWTFAAPDVIDLVGCGEDWFAVRAEATASAVGDAVDHHVL